MAKTLHLTDEHISYLQKIGFPSFEEFAKNPDNYRAGVDHTFESIQDGPNTLRRVAGKDYYWIGGKKVESLGQAMRIANDMGWKKEELDYRVNLDNIGGGKFDHHIFIYRKVNDKTQG